MPHVCSWQGMRVWSCCSCRYTGKIKITVNICVQMRHKSSLHNCNFRMDSLLFFMASVFTKNNSEVTFLHAIQCHFLTALISLVLGPKKKSVSITLSINFKQNWWITIFLSSTNVPFSFIIHLFFLLEYGRRRHLHYLNMWTKFVLVMKYFLPGDRTSQMGTKFN